MTGEISRTRRLTFWGVALLPVLMALALAIYVAGDATLAPIGMRLEGDPLIAYDREIGFIPYPNGQTRRTHPATANRPGLSYNVYTDARSARVSAQNPPSAASVDILTIGCSQSWGHGMDNSDTYASRVADRLGV